MNYLLTILATAILTYVIVYVTAITPVMSEYTYLEQNFNQSIAELRGCEMSLNSLQEFIKNY